MGPQLLVWLNSPSIGQPLGRGPGQRTRLSSRWWKPCAVRDRPPGCKRVSDGVPALAEAQEGRKAKCPQCILTVYSHSVTFALLINPY